MIANWIRVCLLGSLLAAAGCSDSGSKPAPSSGPGPKAPARYGPPTGVPAAAIPRARPFDSKNDDWKKAPFAVVQTELSPVTLFHATTRELSFFTGMPETGLGAPAFASFGALGGPKIVTNGAPMEVSAMTENWILVWFAGAGGWTNWDSPWLLCLQHKPRAAQFDTNGLRLEFDGEAGYAALMPLYGYDKPPQQGRELLSKHGLPERKVKTWTWTESIPREVLQRVRYWAEATREFPLYCEDSFSVDRSRDAVTIRQKFHWLSIDDDWKTTHRKLAPVSPPLAQVSLNGKFPVTISKKPSDMDMLTPNGPSLCIEDVDSYDATFRVLQYVNETEASDSPNTNAHRTVAAALRKLNKAVAGKIQGGDQPDGWDAKALPYCDEAIRTKALASLRKYFHADAPGPHPPEALWACAHHTGDWELMKERWPSIRKKFSSPAGKSWAGFGRSASASASLSDEAGACAALARLAYRAGDMNFYHYACQQFARELVLQFLQQRGADYFRRHQPWHSMEFMDEEVYLTHLGGDTGGWQIDGPKYSAQTGERQFLNRWARFQDADVARFHRDYLKADVRKELNLLTARWESNHKGASAPGLPSLVVLRSLLLNETPAQLARLATPEQFTGPPAGEIASCLAVLRVSRPTRFERLIPGGEPSPFVAGLEREVARPNVTLTQTVQTEAADAVAKTSPAIWPRVTWRNWKTPTGATWNFGSVRPTRSGLPGPAKTIPLNWNSQVTTYELP